MKKLVDIFLCSALVAGFSAPAIADDGSKSNDQEVVKNLSLGSDQIASHDWSGAEMALVQTEFEAEDEVFARINLAYVYSFTGRTEEAADIYREVLEGYDNRFAMTLSGKPRKIKYIAKDGLKNLSSM